MMLPIWGQPILTAAQMRAAEAVAAPTPDAMYALMERAGVGVADAVRRLAAGAEVLILCGPGNNGGDGYVAARVLQEQGVPARVVALTPPRTALARRAAQGWSGPVAHYTTGNQARTDQPSWGEELPAPAPVLVDALFGTGGRSDYADEPWVQAFRPFFDGARYAIAVDLPLGLSAAGEQDWSTDFAAVDLTLALGALKPAHVLPRKSPRCGAVRVVDLGLDLSRAAVRVMTSPVLADPDVWTHKYTRGMVGVITGTMPGAARLAAIAAARAGAGYVVLFGEKPHAAQIGPAALVHRPLSKEALADGRLDVVVVGPGLGRDEQARQWLEFLIKRTTHHLVIDGDALHLLDPAWLTQRHGGVVLTPHGGEHRALLARLAADPGPSDDPFGRSMAEIAALAVGPHIMVHKGATTVVADATQARVAPGGSAWLSTAGTGDVLAGAIAAMVASGRRREPKDLIDAVAAGVWLHAEAARRCGASFIADDLAAALTPARASCR